MVLGKVRHLPVVQNGEVIALLDIENCLCDAIALMERAAEKGKAIAAAVEGVEKHWGTSGSGQLLHQWQQVFSLSHNLSPTDPLEEDVGGDILWTKPKLKSLKVNVDAAVFGRQSVGIGCIVRNEFGDFVHGFSKKIYGCFTPTEAEALVIQEALSWLKESRYDNFTLESDALQVVRGILKPCYVNLTG